MSKYVSNKEQMDSALSGYDIDGTVPIIVDRSVNDIAITEDEMIRVLTTACAMAEAKDFDKDYLTIDRKFVMEQTQSTDAAVRILKALCDIGYAAIKNRTGLGSLIRVDHKIKQRLTDEQAALVVKRAIKTGEHPNINVTVDDRFIEETLALFKEEEEPVETIVGDDEMAMVQLRSGCEKPNGMYATGRESSAKKPTSKTNKQVEQPKPLEDIVNHPSHYTTGGIECIDGICAALTKEELRGYLKGNIIKYVWRERNKAQLTDLRKAQWYLNRLVKEIQDENSSSTGNAG